MSAVTDLTANVAVLVQQNSDLQTAVNSLLAENQDLKTQLASQGADDPAVVQANSDISNVNVAQAALTQSVNSALPAAPAPSP